MSEDLPDGAISCNLHHEASESDALKREFPADSETIMPPLKRMLRESCFKKEALIVQHITKDEDLPGGQLSAELANSAPAVSPEAEVTVSVADGLQVHTSPVPPTCMEAEAPAAEAPTSPTPSRSPDVQDADGLQVSVSPVPSAGFGLEAAANCSQTQTSPVPCSTPEAEARPAEGLQQKVQELEQELFYCRADLQHEEARWAHFRRAAQRLNVWGALMGIADMPLGDGVAPVHSVSHTEALLDMEVQMEQLQQALGQETARATALGKEVERLAAEHQELQRTTLLTKAQDAVVPDKVLDHPLYKKVLACYHQERLLGQRGAQQLSAVQTELTQLQRRSRGVQEALEDQERRRRKKLEQMLYERDHRLQERDAAQRELSQRVKKLEGIAEQASYEQQKLKEYPLLVASLKKELERARQRADHKRRSPGEEALAAEVDSLSRAYEDLAEQNARLLAQLDEKDHLNNGLLTEKLKNQHTISLLKGEVEASSQALELNEALRGHQEAWVGRMQELLQTLQTEERQLARHVQELERVAGQQERELVALRLECEELRLQVARQRETAQGFESQVEQLVRQTSETADDRRKQGEELQRLQSKYEWLRKKANDSASRPAQVSDSAELTELRGQVLGLRAVLNCNVCGQRRKNTIITRCFHIFCAECVDDNLRDRKRKCPQCATKFAESDVKTVFLCEK